MSKSLLFIAVLALWLSACGPRPTEAVPTVDAVATQVARMLTEMPSATPLPTQAPSATPLPPTATQAPTVTPAATQTLTPTPTSNTSGSSLGEPAWKSSLDSGKAFGKVENENTRIIQGDGVLALTGVNANGWLGWSLTFSQQPKDFYLEATFTTQECAGVDQYGLMFRAPNTSAAYFYGVTCDGKYFLDANDFNDNGVQSVIISNTFASSLLAGSNQTNRLGVKAQGDKILLYANDVLLQEVTDSTFPDKGYFGAFVSAYQTAGFTVHMEDIALWNLP